MSKSAERPVRLIAAPYTPFHADGGLHPERIADQYRLLAANGVAGAFVCGTTGEGLSLDDDERLEVAKRWVDAADPGFSVIVHAGHNALGAARRLAAHAQQIGATAIAAMAPAFFRPRTIDDLVVWCREIASAAPELPFYFYHMPGMTGVTLPMVDFWPRAVNAIPTFAGMKFTHNDMLDLGRCLQQADADRSVLFGCDEILLSALALGVRGAVGSTYNFMAPLYQRVVLAFDAGDLDTARREQARSMDLVRLLDSFGPAAPAAGKALMAHVGVDCGPVRRPLRPLDDAQRARLSEALDALHFGAYSSKLAAAAAEPRPAVEHFTA